MYLAGKAYVSVDVGQASTEMEQSAAYRHELLQQYITIAEERPAWGWGRNNYPIVEGMESIDNHYLLLALEFGGYVLSFFLLLLLWMVGRLVIFCAAHRGSEFPGSLALALLGIYLLIIVSIATVYLGGQTFQLMFLLSGWSEALILTAVFAKQYQVQSLEQPRFTFQRVMA
jgi:hypothetical protein